MRHRVIHKQTRHLLFAVATIAPLLCAQSKRAASFEAASVKPRIPKIGATSRGGLSGEGGFRRRDAETQRKPRWRWVWLSLRFSLRLGVSASKSAPCHGGSHEKGRTI
jgi:hypothetical protein